MTLGSIIADGQMQMVQLPQGSHFPEGVTAVQVRVQGQDRILSPVRADLSWESFFLDKERVTDDFMNDRGSQTQSEREPL